MTASRMSLKDVVVTVGPLRIPVTAFADDSVIKVSQPSRDFIMTWSCMRCRGHPVTFNTRCWRCGESTGEDSAVQFFAAEYGIGKGAAIAAAIEHRCTPWDMPTCVERIRMQVTADP